MAKINDEELTLQTNVNSKVIANVANIVRCIDLLDKQFKVKFRGREHAGFHAWLMVELLHNEFHLDELFNYTPQRWKRVEKWMAKWSKRDERYSEAFATWCAVEQEQLTLRDCLKRAGLKPDAVAARIREIEKRGFSGYIPPKYWLNRRAMAITWGSTDEELETLFKRLDEGKLADKMLKKWQERLDSSIAVARKALNGFRHTASLPSVPVSGTVTKIEDASRSVKAMPSKKPKQTSKGK